MAKKKANRMPQTAEETGLKPVRLDLPADIHRLLRRVAADDGKSMSAYARDHLEEHLRTEAKKRGIRE